MLGVWNRIILNIGYTGTGLGLPLVAEHMRLHEGTLEIASLPGKGTTVTVHFPPNRTILKDAERAAN